MSKSYGSYSAELQSLDTTQQVHSIAVHGIFFVLLPLLNVFISVQNVHSSNNHMFSGLFKGSVK